MEKIVGENCSNNTARTENELDHAQKCKVCRKKLIDLIRKKKDKHIDFFNSEDDSKIIIKNFNLSYDF